MIWMDLEGSARGIDWKLANSKLRYGEARLHLLRLMNVPRLRTHSRAVPHLEIGLLKDHCRGKKRRRGFTVTHFALIARDRPEEIRTVRA